MDSFNFCLLMNLSLLNVWKMAHCKQNSRRLLSSFTAGILFVFAWQVCDMVFLHHLWMKCFSWAHCHLKLIYFALGFLLVRYQIPESDFICLRAVLSVDLCGDCRHSPIVLAALWVMFCCLSQALKAGWQLLLQIYYSHILSLRIFSYAFCVIFTFQVFVPSFLVHFGLFLYFKLRGIYWQNFSITPLSHLLPYLLYLYFYPFYFFKRISTLF